MIGPQIGPARPPRMPPDSDVSTDAEDSNDDKTRVIGPTLPRYSNDDDGDSRRRKRKRDEDGKSKNRVDNSNGTQDSDLELRHELAGDMSPIQIGKSGADEEEERTRSQRDQSESSEDIGPRIPGEDNDRRYTAEQNTFEERYQNHDTSGRKERLERINSKPQRDEWMLVPPSSDEWTTKIDPTKIKNRRFNSGKIGREATTTPRDMSMWTETPQERARRLQDEEMGRSAKSSQRTSSVVHRNIRDTETAERVEQYRGPSLLEQHRERSSGTEDDPTKRMFDYEKDIADGTKFGPRQRKDMLEQAKNFQSNFSKSTYL